jgi:hypothetical protein
MCQPFGLCDPKWIQVSGSYRPRQRVCQPFGLENTRVLLHAGGEPGLTQRRKDAKNTDRGDRLFGALSFVFLLGFPFAILAS